MRKNDIQYLLRLPPEIHREVKVQAALKGLSMQEIIEKAVTSWLLMEQMIQEEAKATCDKLEAKP